MDWLPIIWDVSLCVLLFALWIENRELRKQIEDLKSTAWSRDEIAADAIVQLHKRLARLEAETKKEGEPKC